MNKLISLVLSISLIFGSITPSLAQSKIVQGASKALDKGALEAAGAASKASKLPLNINGMRYIPGATVPTAKAPYKAASASYKQTTHAAGQQAADISARQFNPNAVEISTELTKRIVRKINSQIPVMSLTQVNELATKANLNAQDAKNIYHQIFEVTRSESAKDFLVLSTLPTITVERGFALQKQYADQAVDLYRRTLLANNTQAQVSTPLSEEQLKNWSKTMAAATDLGFLGAAKDATLLIDTYKKSPAALQPITQVVIGRALLNLQAYDALEQLAQMSCVNGKLSGDFWSGVQTYVRENSLSVQLPEIVEPATELSAAKLGKLLSSWNRMNIHHLDASAEATAEWAALNENKGKVLANPLGEKQPVETAAAAEQPLPVGDVSVNLDNIQAANNLSVGAVSIPEGMEAAEGDWFASEQVDHIARINSRYANVSYTKEVSQGLQYGLEKAERKYIKEYGKTPALQDPAFQKMWVESVKPELEKLAANNKKLNAKAQQDVLNTLEASFDPTYEVKAIEPVPFFSKAVQFFRSRADRAAATKAIRAAQEARIQGMEVRYPANVESAPGVLIPQDYDIKFVFDSEVTKRAFLNVGKLDSETFVIDSNGSLLLRSPSGSVRGLMGVRINGGNNTTQEVYRVLAARNLAPRFSETVAQNDVERALSLLSEVRVPLRTVLSKKMQLANKELKQFLVAKDLEAAKTAFISSGKVNESLAAVSKELDAIVANNADMKDIVFKLHTDKAGDWALKLTAFSEGLSSFGQAIAAATRLFGDVSSFMANLPSSAGQFGPVLAPFISGLQTRLGLKNTAYVGQILSALGLGISAGSLALGAADVLTPLWAFGGMVGGILVNGIAGNGIIKQTNSPIAKAVANDPVSASSTVADLNSWASAGGIYCYLFLPVVGATMTALFGIETGLSTLAAMFGVAGVAPLASAALLRMSKIQNIKESTVDTSKKGAFWKGIGQNLRFAFTGTQKQELAQLINKKAAKTGVAPSEIKPTKWMKTKAFLKQYLVQMAARVGLYHFGGMAFNSGPGTVLKDVFAKPEQAMLASFFAVYLTVFLGRKLGAKAMGQGLITDKALIGLSSLIAVGAGGLSILPGLDIYTRSALWALAGLGFANLANQEQAMALNRPENAGQKAAVSMIYVLARLTGMGTILYGMFSDQLATLPGLNSTLGAIYGLSMPVLATAIATLWNKNLITSDLKNQIKIWTTKKPKVLTYSNLRMEVESAMINNPNLGVTQDPAEMKQVVKNLSNGLMSRYRIDLASLEQMMISANDKTSLDLYRLNMVEKLYQRLPENTRLATGDPLTYEQFRAEVEPVYNSIIRARVLGKSEEEINKLINFSLDGIMAKYPVGRSDLRVIEARLLKKTRIDRIRLATMQYLYAKQLTKEAETEINSQLKKMTSVMDKKAVVNHVLEKYQAMAKARGVDFIPPANAAI